MCHSLSPLRFGKRCIGITSSNSQILHLVEEKLKFVISVYDYFLVVGDILQLEAL
jgi:hypothetical protein